MNPLEEVHFQRHWRSTKVATCFQCQEPASAPVPVKPQTRGRTCARDRIIKCLHSKGKLLRQRRRTRSAPEQGRGGACLFIAASQVRGGGESSCHLLPGTPTHEKCIFINRNCLQLVKLIREMVSTRSKRFCQQRCDGTGGTGDLLPPPLPLHGIN